MNYLALRKQVLRFLDQDGDVTGELVDAINDALQTVINELAFDCRPIELFEKVGPVNIDHTTTAIPLGVGGFNVSDIGDIKGIQVDAKTTSEVDDQDWDEMSYESYVSQNNVYEGDNRPFYRWVLTPAQEIVLTNWPEDPATWDVYLHYYKLPAAVTDNGVPELPELHHRTLALGAVTYFPQYFAGDRNELFLKFEKEYKAGKERLLLSRRAAKAARFMRKRKAVRSLDPIWGNGQ